MVLLGGGGLAGRVLEENTWRLYFALVFSISFFLLLVYNEGNESLCHMTELSRNFITHARVAGLGAAAVKGSPMFP